MIARIWHGATPSSQKRRVPRSSRHRIGDHPFALVVVCALHERIMVRWDWKTARMRLELLLNGVVICSSGKP
jgi:hypothetical protein